MVARLSRHSHEVHTHIVYTLVGEKKSPLTILIVLLPDPPEKEGEESGKWAGMEVYTVPGMRMQAHL